MSKRRVFDIDFPEGAPHSEERVGAEGRRGPMAMAISESGDATRSREEAYAEIRTENDALAHEFVRLKKLGLIVDLIPVRDIGVTKLTRDRSAARDPEIDELKVSITRIGLSNPIRVEEVAGGYELIQGYRRLQAFRELWEETGDERFAAIPAGLLARGETLESLYQRMVDENLIRRDLSFAEMAELARRYVADVQTDAVDINAAVASLFASASRQKRSYIRHFATLLDLVGDSLRFPEAIPRALGLQLEKKLTQGELSARAVRGRLGAVSAGDPEAELGVLREMAAGTPAPRHARKAERAGAKTTLRYEGPGGMVRCTATEGSILLRAERDFSNLDREALESALEAFFRTLDGEFGENMAHAPKLNRQ